MDEKWFGHKLTRDELRNYIKKSRKGYQGNAFIGRVTEKTKNAVKQLTGIDTTKIILESGITSHVDKQKHNLLADDIEKSVDVINNYDSVNLSKEKTHQGLPVVLFKKNIGGEITFVETVHKGNGGYLSLKTAYRKVSPAPGTHTSTNAAAANVQDASPSTSIVSLSSNLSEKSTPPFGHIIF